MLPRIHTILLTLLFAALLLAGGCNMAEQSTVAQPVDQISTAPPGVTCDQLVTLAETTVGLVCDGIGRNQACYGNRLVSVDFQPNSPFTFSKSGDLVDLLAVRRLSTSPLNTNTRDWGIAVLKAQANLPDALPGQNVTFLLFGDTTVDNPSPDMKAVTVSTRIGTTNCADAPNSGVLIQSPTGSQVAMNINGADVTLGSTAFITTNPETQRMTVAVVEGMGIVSAFNVTQIVPAGAKTGVQLGGGPDGLQASGPPNEPAPYDPTTLIGIDGLGKLLDRQITVPPPISPDQLTPASPTPTTEQQVVATTCAPRSDWTFRYVVQRGDNLSVIALRLNMRTADLQAGNCIDDPNRLIAGQSILVPFPVPTNTPAVPTNTPTPVASATLPGIVGPNLRADENPLPEGRVPACTNIRWDVDNISQVYFEGQPAVGHDSRQVCPGKTTTYTLLVVLLDGSQQTYPLTIQVGYCGDSFCSQNESYSTCSSDCLG